MKNHIFVHDESSRRIRSNETLEYHVHKWMQPYSKCSTLNRLNAFIWGHFWFGSSFYNNKEKTHTKMMAKQGHDYVWNEKNEFMEPRFKFCFASICDRSSLLVWLYGFYSSFRLTIRVFVHHFFVLHYNAKRLQSLRLIQLREQENVKTTK